MNVLPNRKSTTVPLGALALSRGAFGPWVPFSKGPLTLRGLPARWGGLRGVGDLLETGALRIHLCDTLSRPRGSLVRSSKDRTRSGVACSFGYVEDVVQP